jgi:hypothetical protein
MYMHIYVYVCISIHIYIYIVYACVGMCVCVLCLCVMYICIYIRRACRRRVACRAERDAYPFKRGDARGVPRADVCVKCRRKGECLQAEPNAVYVDGKCSHVSARIRVRPNTHTRARMRAAPSRRHPWARHEGTRGRV